MSGEIEIVFNFDTTGSIYPALGQIRRNLENSLTTLFKEIPNLRIGIGANGDYGDLKNYGYTTKSLGLTTDIFSLVKFVREVPPTGGGGNGGEAYELVLNEAVNYSWSLNSRKILVMIGDEIAHTPNYHENVRHLDWRKEANNLASKGIQIYSIQCLSRPEAPPYYSELARIGNGMHLRLDQFTDITDLVMGIIYRQVSVERVKQYETEILSKKPINRTLDNSFAVLTNRNPKTGRFISTKAIQSGISPVPAGRFQIMNVPSDIDIRGFVEGNNIPFMPGKGFYEFTKTEDIQEKKEVVLQDKITGDMFSGPDARNMIGVPFGTRGRVKPSGLPFRVFVQSTSYNRKLKAGTNFLYEVDMNA